MYDNFLTTYAFEQMAREYNARYNKSTLLCECNKDEKIKLKVKNDFGRFSHLFYMLKQAFKFNCARFRDVVYNFESWQKEAGSLFEINEIKNEKQLPKNINHKICALELMEVVESFINTVAFFYKENTIEDKLFFDKSCKMYIKAINLIKEFYCKI